MYVKSKRVARERVGPLNDSGGNLCMEPEEMDEILNEYFASVFTKERDLVDEEPRVGWVFWVISISKRRWYWAS